MESIVSKIICTFPFHPRIGNNKRSDIIKLAAYEDMLYPKKRRYMLQGTPAKGQVSFQELSDMRDYNKKLEELYGIMDAL